MATGYEVPREGQAADSSDTPYALWREDLIAALLDTTLVVGLFLDGWNHLNLQKGRLGSFFTPWHALLYAGFAAAALWVMTRNPHLYLRGRSPKPEFHQLFGIPLRYPFAVAGIALATIGVFGDAIWHAVLGEETGVARVVAPFHLLLFAGGASLISAPLRSGWHAPRHYPARISFQGLLPPLISLTLLTALAAFMFQWLSAFMTWSPSLELGRVSGGLSVFPSVRGTVEMAGAARVVITDVVMMAPILLALRRWLLPFWSVTVLFTSVAVAMASLTNFDRGGIVLAVAIAGLAADMLIRWLRPSPANPVAIRVIAGVVPIVMWGGAFLVWRVFYDVIWPLDLGLGTVGLCAFVGVALSFLVLPPAIPGGAWVEESVDASE